MVVGKFDGVEWWRRWWCWRSGGGSGISSRLTIVGGGENEGEEFFGVGRGVK